MSRPASWNRVAAAAAFVFLGTALGVTSDAPVVWLAGLLAGLVLPVLAGWMDPRRLGSIRREAWAAVVCPLTVILAVAAWNREVLELPPVRIAGLLLLLLVWGAAVPELASRGAAVRAGLTIEELREFDADEELVRRAPRAAKHLGWPLLVAMRLRP